MAYKVLLHLKSDYSIPLHRPVTAEALQTEIWSPAMSKEKGSGFRVCDCDSSAKRNSYFAKRVFLPDDRLATTSGWSGPDVLISILFLGQLNFPNLMFHPCQASEPFDGIPG